MIVNIYHATTLFTVVLYNFRLCIIRTNQSQLYNVLFPVYAAPKLTKMTVTVMFISLVALTAISVSNVLADHIDLEFDVGQCIEASYTAPTTGRASVNLVASDGTVVLHVDYRKHWGGNPSTGQPWQNILILNSKIGGNWGTEQHVEDVETTPGTLLAWKVCAGDADFSIELNHKELATYTYRAPVNTVSRVQFDDQGYDAVLQKLCVVYPAPSQ